MSRSRMRRLHLAAFLALVLGAGAALAQKATEIYIPIGESPGVSGRLSVVGEVESYDAATHTVTIRNDAGLHTARMTEQTRIWLDRSGEQAKNLIGAASDCQRGRKVEVKFVYDGETRKPEAEWIKVRPG